MSIEQKDKEQMEQLIASEKYQQILDKLCNIIEKMQVLPWRKSLQRHWRTIIS